MRRSDPATATPVPRSRVERAGGGADVRRPRCDRYASGDSTGDYAGLTQLFRLLRNARGADGSRTLGPGAAACGSLTAMEDAPPSPSSAPAVGCPSITGRQRRRLRSRPVVSGTVPGPRDGAVECVLQIDRASVMSRGGVSETARTDVYGPVRTVVWQGAAGDRRPYADQCGLSS